MSHHRVLLVRVALLMVRRWRPGKVAVGAVILLAAVIIIHWRDPVTEATAKAGGIAPFGFVTVILVFRRTATTARRFAKRFHIRIWPSEN
jgi:hypothetical protein